MKGLIFILIAHAAFLLTGPAIVYCESGVSSGVVVLGPNEKSLSQAQSSEVSPSSEGSARMGVSGLDFSNIPNTEGSPIEETPIAKISGSAYNSSARLIYDISGSKIGETKVSQEVSLPSEGIVMSVDAGVSRAFIIVKVEEDKKETLVLNVEPERAIGTRLPRGIYKVYPQDLDGAFTSDKLVAKVQIGLVESKIEELP